MSKLPITAIVVSYNAAELLAACVNSLRVAGAAEVIVVDNCSTDDSAGKARNLADKVIILPRNMGFGAACNIGAARSSEKYLLFINPDTEIETKALALASEIMTAHENCGVVGLGLVGVGGEPEKWSFDYYDPGLSRLLARKLFPPRRPNRAVDCAWVSGGALMTRRTVFEQLGGFDRGFFMYWEDADYCRRARQAGWRVLLEPRARVRHLRGGSGKPAPSKSINYDASADRYCRKHYAQTICSLLYYLRRCYRWFWPQAY